MSKQANPPRAWVPWAVGGAAVVGVTAATYGIARAALRPDCSSAGDEGGEIEGVRYLERMRGDAAPGERVPMVVVLHAKDGTPEGYASGMSGIGRARLILPEGGYPTSGFRWFPEGLLATLDGGFSPTELRTWKEAGDRLARFVKAIARCRPTAGSPIVTGSSQGGEMALVMAAQHRGEIAGTVVVNGDMPAALWHRRMAPTIMIHGTGDTTVPFASAQEHALRVIDEGAPIRFEDFASPGHEITSAMGKAWREAVGEFVAQQGLRNEASAVTRTVPPVSHGPER